jgi:hypothetical protein
VRIENNRLAGNGGGIGLVQADRGDGPYGPHQVHDVSVVGNAIAMPLGYNGLVQEGDDSSLYTSRGNHFEGNTYVLGCKPTPFAWNGAYIDRAAWVAAGNDRTGRFTSSCRSGRR